MSTAVDYEGNGEVNILRVENLRGRIASNAIR
jgi:hypothetical protein